jgi:hypothetical protein
VSRRLRLKSGTVTAGGTVYAALTDEQLDELRQMDGTYDDILARAAEMLNAELEDEPDEGFDVEVVYE